MVKALDNIIYFYHMTNPFSAYHDQRYQREVFNTTRLLRRPVTGVVSGYHELPYVLITPDDDSEECAFEINGRISVSPRFIISAEQAAETFGEVFDPDTFDESISGRLFSFAHTRGRRMKVTSDFLSINRREQPCEACIEEQHDRLMAQENVRTGLISGPSFTYYPISIDRYIYEMCEREFRV